MTILRLWEPSLIGDHTLCYIHTNREGMTCINEVEIPVKFARAGENLDGEEYAGAMTVVLPPEAEICDGGFLVVGERGYTLLRWQGMYRGIPRRLREGTDMVPDKDGGAHRQRQGQPRRARRYRGA